MARSTNAVASKARKKRILKQAKGYWGARKNCYTVAKNAVQRGLQYAYRDRRVRKRDFRKLWIQRINAAARMMDIPYRDLIFKLKKANIALNRKVLADLAMHDPKVFKTIVFKVA